MVAEIARRDAAEDVPDGTSGGQAESKDGVHQEDDDQGDKASLGGRPWQPGRFLAAVAAVIVLAGGLGAGAYVVTHQGAPGHASARAASPAPGQSPVAGGRSGVQAPGAPAQTGRPVSAGKPSAGASAYPGSPGSASPGSAASPLPGSPAGGGTSLSGPSAPPAAAPAATLSVSADSVSCTYLAPSPSHACHFQVTAVGGPVSYSVAEPASETADYTMQIDNPAGDLQAGQGTSITLTVTPTSTSVSSSPYVVLNPGSQTFPIWQ